MTTGAPETPPGGRPALAVRDHRLVGVDFIESPNQDPRPTGTGPRLIVVHAISLPPREYGSDDITALFTNRLDPTAHPYFEGIHHLRVSAHLLIRRSGTLIQFVPFDRRAWHAGLSSHRGKSVCNDFSIGIEMEGSDFEPFEAAQYQSLNRCIRALIGAYPDLSFETVTGHEDIAPDRKTDPGPFFEWHRLGEGT